jgi:hypothetical protein
MQDMKFRIKNPQHSEEIQSEGRRLGFEWTFGNGNEHRIMPFLFLKLDGMTITYHDEEQFFNNHPATETTLEELKLMKL